MGAGAGFTTVSNQAPDEARLKSQAISAGSLAALREGVPKERAAAHEGFVTAYEERRDNPPTKTQTTVVTKTEFRAP